MQFFSFWAFWTFCGESIETQSWGNIKHSSQEVKASWGKREGKVASLVIPIIQIGLCFKGHPDMKAGTHQWTDAAPGFWSFLFYGLFSLRKKLPSGKNNVFLNGNLFSCKDKDAFRLDSGDLLSGDLTKLSSPWLLFPQLNLIQVNFFVLTVSQNFPAKYEASLTR